MTNSTRQDSKTSLSDRFEKWKKGPRVAILMGGVVVVILAAAFWLNRSRESLADRLSGQETRVDFEGTLKNKSLVELRAMVDQRFANLSRLELPIQIQHLDQQLILADRIEEMDRTTDLYADKIRLTTFSILDGYNVVHNLGRDQVRDQLIELCNKMVNSDRDEQVRDAFFAMINVSIVDLCRAPSDEEYEACKSVIDMSLKELPDDIVWMQKLKDAFKVMERGEVQEQRSQLLAHVGQQLLASQDPDIRLEGLQYNAHAYFDTGQLNLIDNGMKNHMDSAEAQFNQLCDALVKHPNVAEAIYKSAMAILERNVPYCAARGLDKRLPEISQAIEQIKVPSVKRTLARRMVNLQSRLELLGKPFSFSGETLNHEKVTSSSYQGKPVLMVYFSFQQNASATFLNDLAISGYLDQYNTEMVGVLLDVPKPIHLELLAKRFPGVKFIVNQKDPPVHRSFRVDAAPYVLLLNASHELSAIALDFGDIESALKTHCPLPESEDE